MNAPLGRVVGSRPLWLLLGALVVILAPMQIPCSRSAQPEEDQAAPSPQPPPITLALGGDTMLARLVSQAILRYGASYPWGDAEGLLKAADLAIVNLECVIAEGGRPFKPRRVFYFNARPEAIKTLQAAGIDCVCLANNHAMDFEAEALTECLARLDEAGIAHVGAGEDLESAGRFAMIANKGMRVAVVACADHFREYSATKERPGTKVVQIRTEGEDFDWIKSEIGSAREAGADLVVFSIHWGPNMREMPSREFVRFAHAVMDAGADVFHGHSAHVFQGIEIYKNKPIFYDTGELVDDYAVDSELRNDQGLLYLLTVEGGTVRRIELVPLLISDMQVNQARGEVADEIAARLQRRSAPFKTQFNRDDARILVTMPAD